MNHLTRRRPRALLALAGIGLVVALSACTPNASDAPDLAAGDSDAAYDDWSLEFGDCMKAEGVDVSMTMGSTTGDSGDAGGDDTTTGSLDSVDPGEIDLEAMEAAHEKCIEQVGEPPVQPGMPDADELNEAMLAFAACMREAGYDYRDPEISADGGMVSMQAMSIDEVDPAVMDACNDEAGFPEMPGDDE
ncbi:hypothetical protein SAMN05428970_0821 [Agromyces sp. CF514]|uniref:hypothetical protein n=1 Tax=Agromyces sp. CF514 TaxID=1881031 RepID=UPI0008E7BC1C|nr:hypothetical protein [Agromyces sp. CF514]SFR69950.1 hypothetical protein SAMN05428970_0821 [Agromyces sp. CF514]